MRTRPLLVVIANSKGSVSLALDPGDYTQAIAVNLRRWLDSAVVSAAASGACVTFSVAVHQVGENCDHEVQP